MERWKTTHSDYIFKTPFGNLRKDRCELPNGKKIDSYYVNEYADWVNAVVLTKDRNIVLVRQYRHAVGDFFLEVPAGKLEENETPEEGILREVKEESGYQSERQPILLGEFFVNPATQNNRVISYLIVEAYQAFAQNLDPAEEIELELMPFNKVEHAIQNREINQLFTANAFYMAKSYLKRHDVIF